MNDFWIGEFALMLIWAIAGMGLMLLVGHAGQPSLGHAAFMAVGAYTNVMLQTSLGWPFVVSFPLSGCAAALAGALLALPTARLHGIYLAIATLAVSVLAEDGIVMLAPWTGGVSGIFAPDIKIFGMSFNRYVNAPGFYWLTLGVAVLVVLGYRNILRSPLGRSLVAVRDSEISAQAVGVNLARTKAVSFCAVLRRHRAGRCPDGPLCQRLQSRDFHHLPVHHALDDDRHRRPRLDSRSVPRRDCHHFPAAGDFLCPGVSKREVRHCVGHAPR